MCFWKSQILKWSWKSLTSWYTCWCFSNDILHKKHFFIAWLNPFVPNTPFLYPIKISENLAFFWCFQGVEKGCIGNKWVNANFFINLIRGLFRTQSSISDKAICENCQHLSAVQCFRKIFNLRCLTCFWIHLCWLTSNHLNLFHFKKRM